MKVLERTYSNTDRILCKAKFSAWVFLREILLTAVLSGILTVVWVFAEPIELFFTKAERVQYLADWNLRWAVLGIIVFCGFITLCEYVKLHSKELIVLEDKIVVREGILSVKNVIIPIIEIRIVETKQNCIQRILGTGDLMIVSDAEQPYIIKGIKQANKLSRRIMRQMAEIKKEQEKKLKLQLTGLV